MSIVRRMSTIFLLGFVLTLGVKIANIHAEEGVLKNLPVSVSADVAVNSKYIWRGFTLDDDPVMQEGIYIGAYGFTASIWGSFDMRNQDGLNSDEVDYAIDYTREFGKFSLSVGHTYYDFPGTNGFSKEFYIGTGFDIPLSPALTWYYDYGKEDSGGGKGDYLVAELSHSFPLGKSPITLDLSGHVGYNHKLFINGDGEDAALGMALTIPLTEKITFSPSINYSVPFGDLKSSSDGNQDDKFYGGFVLTFGM